MCSYVAHQPFEQSDGTDILFAALLIDFDFHLRFRLNLLGLGLKFGNRRTHRLVNIDLAAKNLEGRRQRIAGDRVRVTAVW